MANEALKVQVAHIWIRVSWKDKLKTVHWISQRVSHPHNDRSKLLCSHCCLARRKSTGKWFGSCCGFPSVTYVLDKQNKWRTFTKRRSQASTPHHYLSWDWYRQLPFITLSLCRVKLPLELRMPVTVGNIRRGDVRHWVMVRPILHWEPSNLNRSNVFECNMSRSEELEYTVYVLHCLEFK